LFVSNAQRGTFEAPNPGLSKRFEVREFRDPTRPTSATRSRVAGRTRDEDGMVLHCTMNAWSQAHLSDWGERPRKISALQTP
jgi:hypothetical protein